MVRTIMVALDAAAGMVACDDDSLRGESGGIDACFHGGSPNAGGALDAACGADGSAANAASAGTSSAHGGAGAQAHAVRDAAPAADGADDGEGGASGGDGSAQGGNADAGGGGAAPPGGRLKIVECPGLLPAPTHGFCVTEGAAGGALLLLRHRACAQHHLPSGRRPGVTRWPHRLALLLNPLPSAMPWWHLRVVTYSVSSTSRHSRTS
jgi:hypothetical protein